MVAKSSEDANAIASTSQVQTKGEKGKKKTIIMIMKSKKKDKISTKKNRKKRPPLPPSATTTQNNTIPHELPDSPSKNSRSKTKLVVDC